MIIPTGVIDIFGHWEHVNVNLTKKNIRFEYPPRHIPQLFPLQDKMQDTSKHRKAQEDNALKYPLGAFLT